MNPLLDSITVLSFGLLAVLIPVFVFAVSLLGRAIEKASEEYKKKELDLKQKIELANTNMDVALKKVKETGKTEELEQQIKMHKKEKKRREKELKNIKRLPEHLTVKGCILRPGFYFLVAFTLNHLVKYLPTNILYREQIAILLILISLCMLLKGFWFIYLCLKVVQDISLTTEQAQFSKYVEAFGLALDKHYEKMQPKLKLEFDGLRPPFVATKSSQLNINFLVSLSSGEIGRATEVLFFIPKDFSFVNTTRSIWNQPQSHEDFPEYLTMSINLEDLKKDINYARTLTIRTTPSPGNYKLGYRLYCEGFSSEYYKIDIKVT